MERTLTLETRALKAASRQWKELSPEMQRMISMWTLFAHRTAPLIKDLTFTRLPETDNGVYWPARLQVRATLHARFLTYLWGPALPGTGKFSYRLKIFPMLYAV